ncbi:MAG TPA: hypothetical protein VF282_11730 [Bacillota bacterium]
MDAEAGTGKKPSIHCGGPDIARVARLVAEPAPRSLRAADRAAALVAARTCYDHLAGRLGVAVTEAMLRLGDLRADPPRAFQLTDQGEQRLRALGIDVDAARSARRHFTRQCLDWSERRPHLAGALGAAIARHFLDRGWVRRIPGTRGLRVTERGKIGLREAFSLTWDS